MSAYNEGAILQGLNNSVVDMWKFGLQQRRLDRQEERQAELDKKNAEAHALNMRLNQMRVDEADRAITEAKGARQAATPQKATDGFAVGKAGSQNFYQDEAAAKAEAENQAFISGEDAPAAPRQATAITGGGAPKIAGYGVKADNSRLATAKRVADYWRSLGETDKADQIEMQAKETDKKFYDAAREELWRQALIAGKDGPQAFVDALYKGYNDGFDARVTMGTNGGGRVDRIDKDGKPAGSIEFSSMDDLAGKAYQMVFPDKAYAARAATQAEIAKERAKGFKLAPGEQHYGYDASGKAIPLASNENESSAVAAARIRAGAAGAGSSKSGKAGDIVSQVGDLWEMAATKGEIKLPPQQLAQGRRIAEDVARTGVSPALAVEVAMDVATDPNKARLEVDYNTGSVAMVYQNPRVNSGNPILISPNAGTLKEVEQTAGPGKMAQMANDLADKMVSAIPEQQRAAQKSRLVEIAKSPQLTKQYLDAAAAAGKSTDAIARQLQILSSYMPAAKDVDRRNQSASGNANAGLRVLSAGTGLPSSIASDATRVLQDKAGKESSASEERAKRVEADMARKKELKVLQQEASAVPVEAISRSNNLDDLLALRQKYDAVMSGPQREALYSRINALRRQKLNEQLMDRR